MKRSILWSAGALTGYDDIFYSKLMRDYDGLIKGFFGGDLIGKIGYDCGCGTGYSAIEMVKAGAKKVFAIENEPFKVKRMHAKKKRTKVLDALIPVERNMYDGIISELAEKNRPDIIQFKRSLYVPGKPSIDLLKEAHDALKTGGYLFVIHPVSSSRDYIDNGLGGIAPDHVIKLAFNKLGDNISKIKEKIGATPHYHKTYDKKELEELIHGALPNANVKFLSASRKAYNVVLIKK